MIKVSCCSEPASIWAMLDVILEDLDLPKAEEV